MTTPRSQQIDLESTPFYHIVSRCVQRAFLCGSDKVTGKNYEHRKAWIVGRVNELNSIFTIDTCVYSVLSNHFHLIIHIDQEKANNLTYEEIIERWSRLCPKSGFQLKEMHESESKSANYISKMENIRQKLFCISTFMQYLNQFIAKRANEESGVTGRFWEGRFKSQALLDESALLTAMVYVDLNPVRAKIADIPEQSDFTSMKRRFDFIAKQIQKQRFPRKNSKAVKPNLSGFAKLNVDKDTINNLKQPFELMPFRAQSNDVEKFIDFSLSDYFKLVDETSRIYRPDKRGVVSKNIAPILHRLNLSVQGWCSMVTHLEIHFSCAVGHPSSMSIFNHHRRKRAPRGSNFSKQCYVH